MDFGVLRILYKAGEAQIGLFEAENRIAEALLFANGTAHKAKLEAISDALGAVQKALNAEVVAMEKEVKA